MHYKFLRLSVTPCLINFHGIDFSRSYERISLRRTLFRTSTPNIIGGRTPTFCIKCFVYPPLHGDRYLTSNLFTLSQRSAALHTAVAKKQTSNRIKLIQTVTEKRQSVLLRPLHEFIVRGCLGLAFGCLPVQKRTLPLFHCTCFANNLFQME